MEEIKGLLKRAKTFNKQKMYKEAILLLSEEVLEKHKDSNLYAERSVAHNELAESEDALLYANKAISIDGNNYYAYHQSGNAWSDKGEYNNANKDFTRALELKNDFQTAYFNRGHTWNRLGEYAKAIEDYTKAIQLKNDDWEAYNNRGIIRFNNNEPQKAIEDFNEAINLKEDNDETYNNRGVVLGNLENHDKAIADYTKAIALNPKSAMYYNNRGVSWYLIGEFDKALGDYDKAIHLKGNDANTFRNKGDVLYALGEFNKALICYNKARSLDERFGFLEYKIKLTKEKLEERQNLEESKAQSSDKDAKIQIEKEVEKAINTIRNAAKSEVKTIVHYTKVFVADIYVKGIGAKMHYSNAIYMNDPMEGKIFFEYLGDNEIHHAYLNGERRTETSVYLGSFLPAEENGIDTSHEDELVMWRTYGKDENSKEAKGCCLVLSSYFFIAHHIKNKNENEILEKDIEKPSKNNAEELLNVVYVKNQVTTKKITNDFGGKIQPAIITLKEHLSKFIALRDKYAPKDDFYKDIENTIFRELSKISYLFKSADYDFEHEVRVITYMPRNSDTIKHTPNIDPNLPPKRFFIESYNDILPYVKKIFLGPKVENYHHWSLYFDYEIRQRAKELELMESPPYKIKPSDIEILKSVCKFQ